MEQPTSLDIRNLSVNIGKQSILRNINLTIKEGELHVLFGPNGSGKSSLLATIMGLPPYNAVSGNILYYGNDIKNWPIDQRAVEGIGITYQRPPALDGIRLKDLYAALSAEAAYTAEAQNLDLREFSERQINVGFSGGEIKRWEILKLFLQDSSLLLFDEPESGVDLEHISAVGKAINRFMTTPKNDKPRSALIITHTGLILNYIKAVKGHLMIDGEIRYSRAPDTLFDSIKLNGYGTYQNSTI
ncbi:ATP-binding cassette domain-containing protein [Thiomicrorhabdus sp.]|uniref:ATP-binding cassette domain-containing protein n=1 Tax=Thiomicrorhabdus sp. TaxID=2039724 RepID=UPI0029C891A4|nr:ATP-binding cassette domain-containing protein [Thiomicrorhabdus sp.]